jgi:hypothetical protein
VRPGRLVLDQQVVAALERHEPGPRNASRHLAAPGERDQPVVTAVGNERRRLDLREQILGIEATERAE